MHNIEVISYGGKRYLEIDRAVLGFSGLKRIARERNPDIIWSLNIGLYIRAHVPQVLSVNNPHQVYPWEVTRYHPDSPLNVAFLRWFFRKSLRVSDAVIVQTPVMAEYIKKINGSPKSIAVIPKAIENIDDVLPKPLSTNMKKKMEGVLGVKAFTFLYVATYIPHKNHKTLIEAFNLLAAEGVNVRVILTIGLHELVKCCGNKALGLIESGHLLLFGWVEKVYLKSLYEACDACLMPSVLESLSSAHLEAMQWGKPQITSDLPYSHDLCGDAALYVAAEDPRAWSIKIKELMTNSILRERLIAAGQEQMKHFPATWAEVAHNVHAFLENIIAYEKNKNWKIY